MTELLRCPFCGSDKLLFKFKFSQISSTTIRNVDYFECNECKTQGPETYCDHDHIKDRYEKNVKAWNDRK